MHGLSPAPGAMFVLFPRVRSAYGLS